MATTTIEELLLAASEIRDADTEQENTAMRVGTLFVNLIQYASQFMTETQVNDILQQVSDGLEELLTGYAKLNSDKTVLDWTQSPIVFLDSMGEAFDTVNGASYDYTPSVGDLYYYEHSGFQVFWKKDNSPATGYQANVGTVYVNKKTLRAYLWDGNDMSELGETYTSSIQISKMDQTDESSIPVGKTHFMPSSSKLVYRISSSKTFSWTPRTNLIYVDISNNTFYRWQGSSFQKISSSANVINDLTTGGEDDALSAEMGKELGERLEDVEQAGGLTASVIGTTLYFSRVSAGSPVVNVGQLSKSALSARGGQTDTATFTISGRRLTGNIGIALSDGTNFALSASSLTPTDGKVSSTIITVTYQPASGATAGTTHPCTITVSMGGTTYGTLSLNGTVAAAPSITLSPSTLAISALSGEVGSGTINVSGSALDGDITLALSGASYMSFDENSSVTSLTVTKTEAEASGGKNVTIYYTGTANEQGALTATSGTTTASASVNGSIREAAPAGTTFNNNDNTLTFTVLDKSVVPSRTNATFAYPVDDVLTPIVAVKGGSVASANIEIPATVQYDGITYTVTEISNGLIDSGGAQNEQSAGAFYNNRTIKNVTFAAGSKVKLIGRSAFHNCQNLESIILPDSLLHFGSAQNSWALAYCVKLTELTIPASVDALNGALLNNCTGLMKLVLMSGTTKLSAITNGCPQFAQEDDGTLTTTPEGLAKLPVVECHGTTANAWASASTTVFNRNSENWVSAILRYPVGSESSYGIQADHEYSYSPKPTIGNNQYWWHFMVKESFNPNS